MITHGNITYLHAYRLHIIYKLHSTHDFCLHKLQQYEFCIKIYLYQDEISRFKKQKTKQTNIKEMCYMKINWLVNFNDLFLLIFSSLMYRHKQEQNTQMMHKTVIITSIIITEF